MSNYKRVLGKLYLSFAVVFTVFVFSVIYFRTYEDNQTYTIDYSKELGFNIDKELEKLKTAEFITDAEMNIAMKKGIAKGLKSGEKTGYEEMIAKTSEEELASIAFTKTEKNPWYYVHGIALISSLIASALVALGFLLFRKWVLWVVK